MQVVREEEGPRNYRVMMLYWCRMEHILSIHSAYIQHILEQRDNHEADRELEILADSKFELANEDLFESVQIILLVENQHSLLVIDRINRTER